jgi:alpha-1,3-rhamnosyltransferase
MRSDKLVSIVVPAYNHENYIVPCIESILLQDYENIEIIIINDGSSDDTPKKIRELKNKSHRNFLYINKNNEGLVKTLNLGLKIARGEYFCELGSDDILMKESIRERVEFLENNPPMDAVFTDAFVFSEGEDHTKVSKRIIGREKEGFESKRHTLLDLIERNAKIFFPTGMFRRNILEKIKAFDEDFRYCEDTVTRYHLALYGNIGYLDKTLMYYRIHAGNVSIGNPLKTWPEKILALKKVYNIVQDRKIKHLTVEKYLKYIPQYIKDARKAGMKKEGYMSYLKEGMGMPSLTLKAFFYKVRIIYLWCAIKWFD